MIFVLKDFGGDQQNFTKSAPKSSKKCVLYAIFFQNFKNFKNNLDKLANNVQFEWNLGWIFQDFGGFQPKYDSLRCKMSILLSFIEISIKGQLNTVNVLYTMWNLTKIIANTHQ